MTGMAKAADDRVRTALRDVAPGAAWIAAVYVLALLIWVLFTVMRQLRACGRTVRGASSLWFRISLYGQPGPEPPTGWTLAPETVDDMRSQLRVASNQQQIQQLRTLLADSGLNCA
jgi:hypothetical protein